MQGPYSWLPRTGVPLGPIDSQSYAKELRPDVRHGTSSTQSLGQARPNLRLATSLPTLEVPIGSGPPDSGLPAKLRNDAAEGCPQLSIECRSSGGDSAGQISGRPWTTPLQSASFRGQRPETPGAQREAGKRWFPNEDKDRGTVYEVWWANAWWAISEHSPEIIVQSAAALRGVRRRLVLQAWRAETALARAPPEHRVDDTPDCLDSGPITEARRSQTLGRGAKSFGSPGVGTSGGKLCWGP